MCLSQHLTTLQKGPLKDVDHRNSREEKPTGSSTKSFVQANIKAYRTKNCHRIGWHILSCQPTCPIAASVPGVSFSLPAKILQFEPQTRMLLALDPSHPTTQIALDKHYLPSTQSAREANIKILPDTQSIPWLTATGYLPQYPFHSHHSSCRERC